MRKFPEGSTGAVHGPDGPLRRTRANTLAGNTETYEAPLLHAGRHTAWMEEEGAFLNTRSFEE